MSLTKDELLHLAKLSRLRIEDDAIETVQMQLDKIIGYVSRLQSVEVPALEENRGQGAATVRPDVPESSSSELLQVLQAAFPDRVDALLRVPGVFEKPKD